MRRLWCAVALGLALASSGPAFADEVSAPDSVSLEGSHSFRAESLSSLNLQLKNWLREQFQAQGKSVMLEPQGAWGLSKTWLPVLNVHAAEPVRTAEGWSLDLAVLPANAAASSVKAASVRFKVIELHAVWVANASMRKGDQVSCLMLSQDARPRKVHGDSWQGDCAGLDGMRVKHALQPGDVLMRTDVGPASAVRDQQEAIVVTRLGAIEIQAKGMALADAQIGQKVPVRLAGQGKVIQAVVTAPGTVQVMEGMQ
ncbi:MAG: flagellar basal body P-ring formation chaperone FlgA [Aquabacterium sp.]